MTDEDRYYLVCSPATGIPWPGSLQRWCTISGCGVEVWVSGGNVGPVDKGRLHPVCTDCAPGLPDTHPGPMTAATVRDFRAAGFTDAEIRQAKDAADVWMAGEKAKRR